jgi:tetratricopeptide (TPR) repeat protein
LALIGGEPGIGKTRLVGELANYAARRHRVRVLWSTCWEGDGAPAYWPWVQLIGAYIAEVDPTHIYNELGVAAIEIARLVPELGPVAHVDAPPDRVRLFDAVTSFWRVASARQPLLLILDDLHWSDTPSLLLLRFLARDLRAARLLVVGAYRDVELQADHPLSHILGELTGESARVQLMGLAKAEVASLMSALGSPSDAQRVAAMHRQTGGNPFFIKELVRLAPGADPAAPRGVRNVIDRRLRKLSPSCVELLSVAAVLGVEFGLDLLEAVVGWPDGHLGPALDEATRARMIEVLPDRQAHQRFAHALVREVLYAGLSPPRRAALHAQVGRALETLTRHAPDAHLAELAHHFLRAASRDIDTAVQYASRAGRRAMRLLAYEEAAAHFERALQGLERAHGVSHGQRGELLLALGQARMAASDIPSARAAFEQAVLVARDSHDSELLGRVALSQSFEFTVGIVDELEVRLLEEALRVLPPGDGALRTRVMARLAKALLFTPALDRRTALSEEAVAMGRRLGDAATLAVVLFDRHVAIWGFANAEERLAIADEIVQLADECGDHALALQGRALRMANLLELGDAAALQTEMDAYDQITQRLRQLQYLWHVPLQRATLVALDGRFDEAEHLAASALELGRRAQHQGIDVFYATVVTMIRFLQGRMPELLDHLRQMVERYPSIPAWRAVYAYALCEDGQREAAQIELDRLAVDDFRSLPRDFTWMCLLAFLALLISGLDDTRHAAQVYELLSPYQRYAVRVTRIGVACLGSAAHYLALLATALGRWDEAARHFEAALAMSTRLGAPPLLANTYWQYARMLRARGAARDTAVARQHQARAEAMAESLGIRLQLWRHERALSPGAAGSATLCKEGEYWTVAFGQPPFRLKDAVGLAYLARLVGEPDREFHVLDLAAAMAGRAPRLGDVGSAGPLLDAAARSAYRARLAELSAELAEAEAWSDTERAARARAEIDALTEHLSASLGLGGRDRIAAARAERARVSVTKAIKSSIGRIAAHDPALAEHLSHSVRTGTFCTYAPDPMTRLQWRVSLTL